MLNVTGAGILYTMAVFREDDDANAKNIQISFTLDGVATVDSDRSANDSTQYYVYVYPRADLLDTAANIGTGFVNVADGCALEFGMSCQVKVRSNTDALGANPELKVVLEYGLKLT